MELINGGSTIRYGKDQASFDPNVPPPQTLAKLAMMEASRGVWAQRMRDAFDCNEWPFNGDAVAVSDVIALLGEEFKPEPSHKAILTELLSMADGARNVLAQRRYAHGTKQKRVVVLRNVDGWENAGASALYAHYEKTVMGRLNGSSQ
jgi:hypothetical protein